MTDEEYDAHVLAIKNEDALRKAARPPYWPYESAAAKARVQANWEASKNDGSLLYVPGFGACLVVGVVFIVFFTSVVVLVTLAALGGR
jgi:hypothetical protein